MDIVVNTEWEPSKIKCKDHPKYKAIYQPRCSCLPCWFMYERTMIERLVAVRSTIKELRYGG